MKRKAPDARENGKSKVTPRIPVARGQAQGVSRWSVCGWEPCEGRLEAPNRLVQGPCSAKGPGARGGCVGRGGAAGAGWEQGGPTGRDGGAGEGRGSTGQDRAVATEAKDGACLWGCRGPVGQESAQEGILAEAGRAVWNTGTGCKGSAPKHAGRHSVPRQKLEPSPAPLVTPAHHARACCDKHRHLPRLQCPFLPKATECSSRSSSPACHPARQGWSGPMEGNPSTRSLLHALERCSALVAFALPSAACVLCGRADADPDIYGEKSQDNGVCTHENCLVSLPGAFPWHPSEIPSQGLCRCHFLL